MIELLALTAILAQDAFMLMDHLSDRTMDRLLARWHRLADERRWVCPYCGIVGGNGRTCDWRPLYN